MTFLVAYDGSDLSRAALGRAERYALRLDEPLASVTVVPTRAGVAREKGWLGAGASFDRETVRRRIESEVTAIAPDADPVVTFVDGRAPAGTIATAVRRTAADRDADVVFLGSENAGSLVTPISSVGGSVASDDRYDVFIVRHEDR